MQVGLFSKVVSYKWKNFNMGETGFNVTKNRLSYGYTVSDFSFVFHFQAIILKL